MTSIDVNFEDYDSGSEIIRHMHHYYEFTLVTRGTCIHSFRGVDVPLIAGDVFLIPPNESHAYYMHSPASIVNCYFFPERLGSSPNTSATWLLKKKISLPAWMM